MSHLIALWAPLADTQLEIARHSADLLIANLDDVLRVDGLSDDLRVRVESIRSRSVVTASMLAHAQSQLRDEAGGLI